MNFYAHTRENTSKDKWQTIKEHSENVGQRVVNFSEKWCKEDYAANLGLLHDIGKYQSDFQKRLSGENVQVEHSICGAKECSKYNMAFADYCIAGHHSGLPDIGTKADNIEMATLLARMGRACQDYSAYQDELSVRKIMEMPFKTDISKTGILQKKEIAFWTRMMFSCLVDADYLDTEKYCMGEIERGISVDFADFLEKLNKNLQSFSMDTDVKIARQNLQKQIERNKNNMANIYFMNMPTGSGKTLASMQFALERAVLTGKKHIIYVIPYTSIIEQNARVFKSIFGEDKILEHHCNFDFDSLDDENISRKMMYSCENWDASIIVTTNVQFFQSIYGNRSSQLRKIHNISDSIIIFDEAHMFSSNFYQPCLEAIKILTKQYNCEAVLLSATMPDFQVWLKEFGCDGLTTVDLIEDKSSFPIFNRSEVQMLGNISVEKLAATLNESTSNLIVVNTRKAARTVFNKIAGEKFHLSTYMTTKDRLCTIDKVKEALLQKRKFSLVSTSLIEAGVDLDFERVYRELAGLDNLIQTSGRCNREGLRENCKTFAFEFEEAELQPKEGHVKVKQSFCKSCFEKFTDVTSPKSIEYYFSSLYRYYKDEMNSMNFEKAITTNGFNFKSYADSFKLIDDYSQGVIILYEDDEPQKELLTAIKKGERVSGRRLQKYVVALRRYELDKLLKQGVIWQKDNMYILTNKEYYDRDIGMLFDDNTTYIL